MFFTSKSTAQARKTRLSIGSLVSPCGFGCHFILASENELQTLSNTSHEKYSQINVHVHIKKSSLIRYNKQPKITLSG